MVMKDELKAARKCPPDRRTSDLVALHSRISDAEVRVSQMSPHEKEQIYRETMALIEDGEKGERS